MALDYPEEHRREALGITAAVVVLLALVCFFLKFSGPNPPLTALGGDGVELNYGLDEAGSGDIQTTATANASQNREDSRPPAATQPQPAQPRTEPTPAPQPQAQEKVITSDAEDAGTTAPPVEKPTTKAVEPVRETPTPPSPANSPAPSTRPRVAPAAWLVAMAPTVRAARPPAIATVTAPAPWVTRATPAAR